MNKEDFLKKLNKHLKPLPESEKQEVLRYYDEYIEEMENKQEGILKLGDPRQLANQILKDSYIQGVKKTDSSAKKGLSTIAIVFLSIFAAPIGLPLILALFILAFSLVLVLLILVITFYFLAITFVLVGILLFLSSFIALPLHFLSFLTFIGVALIALSLGSMIFIGTSTLVSFLSKKVIGLTVKNKNSQKTVSK